MSETVFIHGLQKTSTSPLVGLLNSHPDICVLYETNLFETRVSKYGNQLLKGLPDTRQFFFSTDDTAKPYRLLAKYLQHEKDLEFSYFGDKLLSFDARLSQPHKNKVIYMMRDVRTWLVKELIRDIYRTDIDCVRPAIEYLKFIVHARTNKHAISVRLEDLISDHPNTVAQIGEFLNVEFDSANWQKNEAAQSRTGVKSFQKWQRAHPSSRASFKKPDVKVELENHPFWDAYLPVFDKYYLHVNPSSVSEGEKCADLKSIDDLTAFCSTPIEKLYRNIEQTRLTSIPTRKVLKARIKKLVSKFKAS